MKRLPTGLVPKDGRAYPWGWAGVAVREYGPDSRPYLATKRTLQKLAAQANVGKNTSGICVTRGGLSFGEVAGCRSVFGAIKHVVKLVASMSTHCNNTSRVADQGQGRRTKLIRASLLETLARGGRPIRWFCFRKIAKEKRFAKIASLEILDLYVSQRIANPDLCGRPLYQKVTSKYLDVTDIEALDVVKRAEQSFAIWPHEREVRLQDVARYIIVNEYIEMHGIRSGVGSHFKKVVHKIISDKL